MAEERIDEGQPHLMLSPQWAEAPKKTLLRWPRMPLRNISTETMRTPSKACPMVSPRRVAAPAAPLETTHERPTGIVI